jgi:Phage capsid protein
MSTALFNGETFNQSNTSRFIAEIWLPEMMAFREQRLFVPQQFCKVFSSNVKKGDVFHIPQINELVIEDRQIDKPFTLQTDVDNEYTVQVDSDKAVAIGIDNFAEAMASYQYRSAYVKGMGYALAKDVAGAILGLRAAVYNIPAQNIFCTTGATNAGTLAGTGAPLNLSALLAARQLLLDADVPEEDIMVAVSTAQETALLSILQSTSSDYIDGRPTVSGKIGSLYGMNFWRSTLITNNSATSWRVRGVNNVIATLPSPGFTGSIYLPKQDAFTSLPSVWGGGGAVQSALVCSKEWAVAVMQNNMTPKVDRIPQLDIEQILARQSYGAKLFRRDHAVLVHTLG